MAAPERLVEIAASLQIPEIRRHVFLGCDQTKPKCCVLERIIQEHLIGGRVVVEWAFARRDS